MGLCHKCQNELELTEEPYRGMYESIKACKICGALYQIKPLEWEKIK